jgi:hypothetical protein
LEPYSFQAHVLRGAYAKGEKIMSTKVMDEILSRLFLDGEFRERLRTDPQQALVWYGYDLDLTAVEKARLSKYKRRTPKTPPPPKSNGQSRI